VANEAALNPFLPYVPISTLQAAKVRTAGTIAVYMGTRFANAGDYVLKNADGSLRVMDKASFEAVWIAQ
jgi:hypothetical protein